MPKENPCLCHFYKCKPQYKAGCFEFKAWMNKIYAIWVHKKHNPNKDEVDCS